MDYFLDNSWLEESELIKEDQQDSHWSDIPKDKNQHVEKWDTQCATVRNFIFHHLFLQVPSHENRDEDAPNRHAELTYNPVAEVEDGAAENRHVIEHAE